MSGCLAISGDLELARLEEAFSFQGFSCGLQRTDLFDLLAAPLDELAEIDDILERDVQRLVDGHSLSLSENQHIDDAPAVALQLSTSYCPLTPSAAPTLNHFKRTESEATTPEAAAGVPCSGPVLRPMCTTGRPRGVLAAAGAGGIFLRPVAPARPPDAVGPEVTVTAQCRVANSIPVASAEKPLKPLGPSTSGSSSATCCDAVIAAQSSDVVVSSGAEGQPTATRKPKKKSPTGAAAKRSGRNLSPSSQPRRPTSSPDFDPATPENITIRCQVCSTEVDQRSIRKYIRCRKVCNDCRTSPSVMKGGKEVRFCQLCSWFHPLSAFSGERHSCKHALHKHNERRRVKTANNRAAATTP